MFSGYHLTALGLAWSACWRTAREAPIAGQPGQAVVPALVSESHMIGALVTATALGHSRNDGPTRALIGVGMNKCDMVPIASPTWIGQEAHWAWKVIGSSCDLVLMDGHVLGVDAHCGP